MVVVRRNPGGAKARIVTDGCRALLLHGRVGRMGQGGGECGSGAGHIPRRPSGRHLSRGNGSEQEKKIIKRIIRRNAPGVAGGSDPLAVRLSSGR